MKYTGSKRKILKDILPIILRNREKKQWYIEPFCGGGNVIFNIDGPRRIANDINYYLIELFKALQNDWLPPKEISEEYYNEIKNNKNKYPPCLVGYVGFQMSFGCKFFGGYSRNTRRRNFSREAFNNILKDIPKIKNIIFENKEYFDLKIPEKSLIYCDPPYKNSYNYKIIFDHNKFYNWCREKVRENHLLFVSEYEMPKDFICIWEKEIFSSLDVSIGKRSVEKLFIHESQENKIKRLEQLTLF